jgi:hypothetical protein
MASQPNNSRIVQVINFGVDKRIPLGIVNQVIDKSTGYLIGYMRGDKFYELSTDATVVDAEQAKAVEDKNKFDQTLASQQAQADPFLKPFTDGKVGVTVDPETGKTIVSDGTSEIFIYVGPSAPKVTYDPGTGRVITQPAGKDTDIEVINDFDAIRKKMLTDATATPGGMDSLFEKLYKNGSISEETYKSKNVSADDFNKGLLYSVRKFSIETVDKYTLKGDKKPVNFTDFLVTGFKPDKPISKTTYESIITRRQDAAEDADQFFMANLGRNATKEEENSYYELLRDA